MTLVQFEKGDRVRLQIDPIKIGIGISICKEWEDILNGVMTVERTHSMPLDDLPEYQIVYIIGLPFLFSNKDLVHTEEQ